MAIMGQSPVRTIIPNTEPSIVRLLGTGASAPTVAAGIGITITRAGVGDYTITWSDDPGEFLGVTFGLNATTPSALVGYNVEFGAYNSTAFSLQVLLTTAAEAAHDLAAAEWITVVAWFAHVGSDSIT